MSAPNPASPTVQSFQEAVAQDDSVNLNWVLFDESVNIHHLSIPSKLFKGQSGYCRPLFVEPLRERCRVAAEAEDIEFWKAADDTTLFQRRGDLKDYFTLIEPADSFLDYYFGKVTKSQVHLVITFKPTKRRRASSGETVLERLKRTILVTTAPRVVAQPSQYERLQQKSEERILDDRPKPDTGIAPITLLYDGFGQFLDIVDGHSDVEGLSSVDTIELRKCVDDFAASMCGFFGNEDARGEAILPFINKIFAARKGSGLPELRAAAIGPTRTDGHSDGEHKVAITIVKFQNRFTGIPEVEMIGYFAQSLAAGMARRERKFEGWMVPCLGLTIVGLDLKFYAMLNLDHQFRLVGVTPTLSCTLSASDGRDRNAMYTAFTAASVLRAHILQHAHDRLSLPVPHIDSDEDDHLPTITKLRRYQGESDDFLTFNIILRHPDKQSYRHVYFAETESREVIIVKFVQQYSTDLHGCCASAGHAPHLLAFQRLPGGWYGVAMDYILDAVPITASLHLTENFERWKLELQNLVQSFHKRGLVHGDLRDANLLCGDDGCVSLIDFDWGGMDGEVSYPTPNLHPELLEVRLSDGLKITKDNDLQILENTLAKVKKLMSAG